MAKQKLVVQEEISQIFFASSFDKNKYSITNQTIKKGGRRIL